MIKLLFTPIAGINFHKQEANITIGPIIGYAKHTYTEVDPNAIGLYNTSDKLLGFIPAKEVGRYNEFFEIEQPNILPFAGNIKSMGDDDDAPLVGNIAVISSDHDPREIIEEYMAKDFNVFGKVTTRIEEQ